MASPMTIRRPAGVEICSFHSAMAESARSTICWRRTCLSRTGECDVSSIRPNVTFMGSNFSDGGLSEQWRASDPIAVVYGIGNGLPPLQDLRDREAHGEPRRRALDVALDARDLAGEDRCGAPGASARSGRGAPERGCTCCGGACRSARTTRSRGPGSCGRSAAAPGSSASSGSRRCCSAPSRDRPGGAARRPTGRRPVRGSVRPIGFIGPCRSVSRPRSRHHLDREAASK